MTNTGTRENRMATFQGICSHFTFYKSIHTDNKRQGKGTDTGCSVFLAKKGPQRPQGLKPGTKDMSLLCYTNSFYSVWLQRYVEGFSGRKKRRGRMEGISPLSDWQVTCKPRKVTQDYTRIAWLLITNRIYFAKIRSFSWKDHKKD